MIEMLRLEILAKFVRFAWLLSFNFLFFFFFFSFFSNKSSATEGVRCNRINYRLEVDALKNCHELQTSCKLTLFPALDVPKMNSLK